MTGQPFGYHRDDDVAVLEVDVPDWEQRFEMSVAAVAKWNMIHLRHNVQLT